MPSLSCAPKNGYLRNPDFTRHKLNQPKQYQYSQHPILLVVSNISNSLEDKVDKSAVATSYQVGWIDYTLQDILGQKF